MLTTVSCPVSAQPAACSGGTVALTIDDAPGPDTTAILAALQTAGMKATFFLIGQHVQQFPAIAQQIVAQGHEIANHSWSHPVMNTLTQAEIDNEILLTNNIIFNTTGVHPVYFRPPYGQSNQLVVDRAQAAGLTHMWWTIDTEDYTGISATTITQQVSLAQPSGVVLLHNWSPGIKQAIPLINTYWKTTLAANPICYGRLAPTTNAMPVHDWWGNLSYVHAEKW